MRPFAVVFMLIVLLFACQTKTEETASKQNDSVIVKLDAVDFKTAIQNDESDKIILDVRTPSEFNSGAIPNSINIDYRNENFGTAIESLDKSSTVYVYCQGGVRSSKAAEIMEAKGFKKIIELEKGFSSY